MSGFLFAFLVACTLHVLCPIIQSHPTSDVPPFFYHSFASESPRFLESSDQNESDLFHQWFEDLSSSMENNSGMPQLFVSHQLGDVKAGVQDNMPKEPLAINPITTVRIHMRVHSINSENPTSNVVLTTHEMGAPEVWSFMSQTKQGDSNPNRRLDDLFHPQEMLQLLDRMNQCVPTIADGEVPPKCTSSPNEPSEMNATVLNDSLSLGANASSPSSTSEGSDVFFHSEIAAYIAVAFFLLSFLILSVLLVRILLGKMENRMQPSPRYVPIVVHKKKVHG